MREKETSMTVVAVLNDPKLPLLSFVALHNKVEVIERILTIDGNDIIDRERSAINMGDPAPLWCVAFRGHGKDTIAALLALGADPNKCFEQAVCIYCYVAHKELAQEVLRNSSPLFWTILNGDYESTKLLLQHRAVIGDYERKIIGYLSQEAKGKLSGWIACIDAIEGFKSAFVAQNGLECNCFVALALNGDAEFFIDYLESTVRQINTKNSYLHKSGGDVSFLKKMIDICFDHLKIIEKDEPTTNHLVKYFQDNLVSELRLQNAGPSGCGIYSDEKEMKIFVERYSKDLKPREIAFFRKSCGGNDSDGEPPSPPPHP